MGKQGLLLYFLLLFKEIHKGQPGDYVSRTLHKKAWGEDLFLPVPVPTEFNGNHISKSTENMSQCLHICF
ncbi:hypothetical protein Y1Q_0023169 [Alligator mississippiensis]|uniref:Uncharacterized protein n=1 Tax=Alligator mississippiensis TaxID=8496 RepID=A0A151MZE3_ALLMI|nr:hypothetical protein Y1Q_0023169 [Alligator mississippiensis]